MFLWPNLDLTPAVVFFSACLCFSILFIQIQAFSDSCAQMSSSKLDTGSCEVKHSPAYVLVQQMHKCQLQSNITSNKSILKTAQV